MLLIYSRCPRPIHRIGCYNAGMLSRDTWQARLNAEFPNRNIVGHFEFSVPVCEVSFFQAMDWHIQAASQVKSAGKAASRVNWRHSLAKNPCAEVGIEG